MGAMGLFGAIAAALLVKNPVRGQFNQDEAPKVAKPEGIKGSI